MHRNIFIHIKPILKELGEHFFPPYLQLFERKKYVMIILISEQNFKGGSTVYEVTKMGDVIESSGQFTPSEQETMDQQGYSPMNVCELSFIISGSL